MTEFEMIRVRAFCTPDLANLPLVRDSLVARSFGPFVPFY